MLTGQVKARLLELLKIKADELSLDIQNVTIMPDYVHLFLKAGPALALHFIVGQLKGYSSRILRNEFPSLK